MLTTEAKKAVVVQVVVVADTNNRFVLSSPCGGLFLFLEDR